VPLPVPESANGSYHDFYVGYQPEAGQDRFYGGGTNGYYVYDVTKLEEPQLLVSLTGINGVSFGHTFTPTPDGRYAVAETEYQYAPLRIFDLKPGLDDTVKNIREPIGVWTADWRHLMEGFAGWNGKDWGMPDISSAQRWDDGPAPMKKGSRP
jgi:hypothetical protein